MNRPAARPDRGAVRRLRWLAVPAALALASLSFAQAAAGVGLPLGWFAELGPSFFAWQPGHRVLEAEAARQGLALTRPERLHDAERYVLPAEPLSSAPLRLVALADARRGRHAEARQRMSVIQRLTRRDPAAQLWLVEDAVRRGDVAGTVAGYDVLLRTQPEHREPLLDALSAGLAAEPVRSAVAGFADARSPWFPELLRRASTRGQASQVAALLASLPVLADSAPYRSAYAATVKALAEENRFAVLHGLYPRIPGAGGKGSPMAWGLAEAPAAPGYAPFRWNLAENAERTAQAEQDALAVRAVPLTVGIAASRLLLLPPDPIVLSWTVRTVDRGAPDAGAYWAVRCRDTQQFVRTTNLLGVAENAGTVAMPYPCAAAEVTLVVDGGTGGDGVSFRLARLRLLPASRLSQGPPPSSKDSSR